MARGLADLPEEPTNDQDLNEEVQQLINDLILGQNKLHDRLIDLERKVDHMLADAEDIKSKQQHSKWRIGL